MTQIDSRIKIKRSSNTGAVPTLAPSSDNRDGTWSVDDIYPGELYLNDPDGRLWIGTTTGVIEVAVGSTSGIADTPFVYGSTAGGALIYTSIQPDFGTVEIDAPYSSILGGNLNSILGATGAIYNSIVGGQNNDIVNTTASHKWNSILGGRNNTITSSYGASNLGGQGSDITSSNYGISGGRVNKLITSPHALAIGGRYNTITNSTDSSILGGYGNKIYGGGNSSFIGNGSNNKIHTTGNYNVITGGYYNAITVDSEKSVIVGGIYHTLDSSELSFIGGGYLNKLFKANHCTIVGGRYNYINIGGLADQQYNFIGGGNLNIIAPLSDNCTIVGGVSNNTGGYDNVHIIGSNITATAADTTYVENLDIENVALFGEYTVATLPTASSFQGGLIMVTDETGGYVPAFSDGTNWRRVTDRVIVS